MPNHQGTMVSADKEANSGIYYFVPGSTQMVQIVNKVLYGLKHILVDIVPE